ncbi:pyocin activator protein PrtN [Halomonas eurihalina]|uniref:Pyocin activator protein PrtN n=1 Tax=Halomonas eurihalina TaxID=42566 RepID=A0A5D9DAB4_HALER|nr:pyocin activator PrtN family protein [Halomonas eurihalina]MDR5859446.1 pyocin activator PrtN family protein [Halomonas eurihalina]TZG40519.1 pyocin activator protein PrtN [Halomonas eurihalina]
MDRTITTAREAVNFLEGDMKTELLLLAKYEQVLIPLKVFAKDIMGIELQTARNRISAGTFPVPLTRTGRDPMVHVADAAAYIDAQRDAAA